jgi:hypothetical protein
MALESLLATCCDAAGDSCISRPPSLRLIRAAWDDPQTSQAAGLSSAEGPSCRDALVSFPNASRGAGQRIPTPTSVSQKLPLFATPNAEPPRLVWGPVWFYDGPPTPLDFCTSLLI